MIVRSMRLLALCGLLVACGGESNSGGSLMQQNTQPILNLQGKLTVSLGVGDIYAEPGYTATDAEDGDITAQVQRSPSDLNTNVIGDTLLTYSVQDSQGGTATATRILRITATQSSVDNTPPTVTLVGTETVRVIAGGSFNWGSIGATAHDAEDGVLTVSVSPSAPDTLPTGEHILTYFATDSEGLQASATRNLIVSEPLAVNQQSMGMGLNGINDWTTQIPFIDLMKQSRAWKDWINRTELDFDVDENDWLLSLQDGQTAGTVFLTMQENSWHGELPFDRAHVFYEGEGVIRYTVAARRINNESVTGHHVVSLDWGNAFLSIIETNPDNPIRNIRIIPEPFLDTYNAREIFNPQWLSRIEQFRALRFMDWMRTNNSTLAEWENRPKRESRTWRSAPLEIMIELANTVNAAPWFTIPHLADDNFVQQFATVLKEQLNPSLIAYIEHSNEVWNWQFQQAQYANTTGRARWGDVGNAYMQWHGMRTAQICDAFKLGHFANETDRIKCVLGVQTSYHGLQKGAMECPLWVEKGNEACHTHGFDYIAVTSYFAGALNGPSQMDSLEDTEWETIMRGWIAEGDTGVQKAIDHLKTGDGFRSLERYTNYQGAAAHLQEEFEYWVDYAHSFDLEVIAYEGGQHITGNGKAVQNDDDFINFHIAINQHSEMYDIYTDVFNAWKDSGAQLHMHFVDIGKASKYGSWGALENYKQETSSRWQAIEDFNTQVACWWDNCDE